VLLCPSVSSRDKEQPRFVWHESLAHVNRSAARVTGSPEKKRRNTASRKRAAVPIAPASSSQTGEAAASDTDVCDAQAAGKEDPRDEGGRTLLLSVSVTRIRLLLSRQRRRTRSRSVLLVVSHTRVKKEDHGKALTLTEGQRSFKNWNLTAVRTPAGEKKLGPRESLRHVPDPGTPDRGRIVR
jgi:hypothetical protein